MGTSYKGGSVGYRSISQNIPRTSVKYKYSEGRFGDSSPHTGNHTRNISSSDPLSTAKDFYDLISYGGKEIIYSNNLKVTSMSDGTKISMREVSSSDGTPVVEVNIKYSNDTSGIKNQKIHFIKEKSND